jgi:hypothetical protein
MRCRAKPRRATLRRALALAAPGETRLSSRIVALFEGPSAPGSETGLTPEKRNRANLAAIRESANPRPRPAPWRPNLPDFERALLLSRARQWHDSADIARRIGAPVDEFSKWFSRVRAALGKHPTALQALLHLCDLRAAGRSPPAVLPSDVLRRESALARAARLAALMPDGWPNPPLEFSDFERRDFEKRRQDEDGEF